MAAMADDATLSPMLLDALQSFDEEEREPMRRFFLRAVETIGELGELDLLQHESDSLGVHNLDLWEALAPKVKETLESVNRFLEDVRHLFPEVQATSLDEIDFDSAFAALADGSTAAAPKPTPPPSGTEAAVAIASGLAQQVTEFGEGLRKPVVMTDQWFLLDHVQTFRGRFHAGIGEMLFATVQHQTDGSREDIIPFYREDVETALALRHEIASFRDTVLLARRRLEHAQDPKQARADAKELLENLKLFIESDGYRVMRAADKREILKTREHLRRVSEAAVATRAECVEAAEGLARLFDSLNILNRRETLLVHDRTLKSDLLATLEKLDADLLRGRTPGLGEAVDTFVDRLRLLLGRQDDFDHVVRVLDTAAFARADPASIRSGLQLARQSLQALHI